MKRFRAIICCIVYGVGIYCFIKSGRVYKKSVQKATYWLIWGCYLMWVYSLFIQNF